jgi:O-antigen ligase
LLGHGTGGTRQSFGTIGGVELKQGVPNNPHNQTLMTGTQLGLAGIALLWAMWFFHLAGAWSQRWEAQLCSLIVVQNIVASIFNSHLSDFTSGWFYVLGVGVLGGAIWREREASPSSAG